MSGISSSVRRSTPRSISAPLGQQGLALPRTGLLFYSRLPNTEDVLWDEEALWDENMLWGGWILPVECYALLEHDDGFWFSDSTTPVARTGEEILAWPWINTGNIEFSLAAGLSVRWNRIAYYKKNSITDADGANTRTLYGLQYIHLAGATDFTNASIVGTETVTSQPAGTAVITVAAGKLTIAAGDLWSFALSNGSTYEFGTILTATTGVVFDTSGNGRHLLFTVADTAAVCISGLREKGSDAFNTGGIASVSNMLPHAMNFERWNNNYWDPIGARPVASGTELTFNGSTFQWVFQDNIPLPEGTVAYMLASFRVVSGYVPPGGVTLKTQVNAIPGGNDRDLSPGNDGEWHYCAARVVGAVSGFCTISITSANSTATIEVRLSFFFSSVGDVQSPVGGTGFASSVPVSELSRCTPLPKKRTLCLWGDSTTSQNNSTIQPLLYSYFNFLSLGVGGETVGQIKTRFDAQPSLLDCTTCIWAGANDVENILANAPPAIAQMVSDLGHDNYLIISPLPNCTYAADSQYYVDYRACLDILSETYGDKYLDVLTLLQQNNNGSAQDLADVAKGVHPTSLRIDIYIHLNAAGNVIVANAILNKLLSLGYHNVIDDVTGSSLSVGKAKLNITPISNAGDITLTPLHTYSLADSAQMRDALGWVWGVDHWAFSDAGVPKVVSYETMVTNGVGPRCYVGTKGAAVYEVDMDTEPADKDAKIKKYLKVTA